MNASMESPPARALEPAANEGIMRTRTERLRQMLLSDQLEFLMEAHNGLSARIVREAGFKGIWGSGLSISAQFGVRDNNEASWTQVVDMLEFMADGRLNIKPLLTHTAPVAQAPELYRMLHEEKDKGMGVVFRWK